jgi:hypothetical protein
MVSPAKPGALGLSQVYIAPEAYAYLHGFLASLHRRVLERAAHRAQVREREAGPARISVEDMVRSGQTLLPLVGAELERSLNQESTNVRHASR